MRARREAAKQQPHVDLPSMATMRGGETSGGLCFVSRSWQIREVVSNDLCFLPAKAADEHDLCHGVERQWIGGREMWEGIGEHERGRGLEEEVG